MDGVLLLGNQAHLSTSEAPRWEYQQQNERPHQTALASPDSKET